MAKLLHIRGDKSPFLPFLFLGNLTEEGVSHALSTGQLWALREGDETIAVCLTLNWGHGLCEIKSLAVAPWHQRLGFGTRILKDLEQRLSPTVNTLFVAPGEAAPFFARRGFIPPVEIEPFVLNCYRHPIVAEGVLPPHTPYLAKAIGPGIGVDV